MKKMIIKAGGGIVVNEQNEVLLIYRRGKWDLPKGKLDDGETIEECALREVKEETGLL
jgi:8-oxo-dGTP pyrophosphatase MutT (NUDIX family)